MKKTIQKKVNLKIVTLLHSAVCVGALSLLVVSSAFAGGTSSTPPPLPPCGDWNDIGTLSASGALDDVDGYVYLNIDRGKPPTALAGVEIEAKKGATKVTRTTDVFGRFQIYNLSSGTWTFRAKKSGHRFKSSTIVITKYSMPEVEATLCR